MARGKQASGLLTQQKVLRAAVALFLEKGYAKTTTAEIAAAAGIRQSSFNMSRTLSIGKVGPGPDFSGSGPFSISTPPAATSACLSDARLRSLISARGASLRWAIRCYGWGYLGRFGSLWSRVAPWALAEKKSGVRPNGLGSDRRMGCERRDVGLARHRDALGALDHAADRPAPARELAGGRHVGLVLVDAALEHRGPPADEPSHALGGMAPRAGVRRLAFGQVF